MPVIAARPMRSRAHALPPVGKDAGSPPSRGRLGAARQAGFSLLEIIVAFVILSLVVTALYRLFGGALGNASAADEWSRAVLVAQSQLAAAASVQPLRPRTDHGRDDEAGIEWQTRVAPYVVPAPTPDLDRASETMPTRLYQIAVDVRFPGVAGQDRTFTLTTLRLAPRETVEP